jgi:hypothetical protein
MAAKARGKKKQKKTAKRQSPSRSGKTKAVVKKAQKKIAAKSKAVRRKTAAVKRTAALKKTSRNSPSADTATAQVKVRPTYSDVEAGDLQGLSRKQRADSESVDELLEESNALEAEVVAGVEDAGNTEGQEVHTHEVPEDDVPDEYLDKE